jgi:hypothetical protein
VPVPPFPFAPRAPVASQVLNKNLYSYDGSGFGANGILFHAHRPVLAEALTASPSMIKDTTGYWNWIQGTPGLPVAGTAAFSVLDTAALFGLGSDSPGVTADYHFIPQAAGSAGSAATTGGWYLTCQFTSAPAFASNVSALGAGMYAGGTLLHLYAQGAMQRGNNAVDSLAPYVDLFNSVDSNANSLWLPGAFFADASGTAVTMPVDSGDTSGISPRAMWAWCCVSTGGGTVSSFPAPQATWTAASAVSSTALNQQIGNTLSFLNRPPVLKANQFLATNISNNTVTSVPLTSVAIDTYLGFSGGTYTVQMPGVYLVSCTVPFASSGSGQRYAGVKVTTGGVTTSYQGPSYINVNTGGVTTCMSLRLLDLAPGDAVTPVCWQNSGGTLGLSVAYDTRMIVAWLGGTTASGTTNTWTAPGTSFHWTAGIPGSQLPALFTQHIGNDLNFLLGRPYWLTTQTSAQSGFGNNTWQRITMDTVGGIQHSSSVSGDNYGGWVSGSRNAYVAQVPGWYLVTGEIFTTIPNQTSSCQIIAAIGCSTSGGVPPAFSPDWYQAVFPVISTGVPQPGACMAGIYYLNPGEYVYPMMNASNFTSSTWGTSVSNVRSHFCGIWMCE